MKVTQPVDGARRTELGSAEPLHEVAASAAPGLLERREHAVGRGEPAGRALAHHRAAGDHTVPLEQALGDRVCPLGGVGLALGQQEPAPGDLGWRRREVLRRRAAAARGRTRAGCALDPVGAAADPGEGAQRREGVVADAAGPGEVPERGRRAPCRPRSRRPWRAGGRSRRLLRPAPRAPPRGRRTCSSSPWSGRVRCAVSAMCSETQPSEPGRPPCPAQSTSPVAVSSSSIEGW